MRPSGSLIESSCCGMEKWSAVSNNANEQPAADPSPGQALTDLAGASLEERLASVFIGRLGALDAKAKAELAEALETATEPALVRSAFDLPAAQCAAVRKALAEMSEAKVQVQFETAPDLISGIELTTHGRKIAWSIADYLTSLIKGVDELLQKQEHPATAPKTKTTEKTTTKAKTKTTPKSKTRSKPKHDEPGTAAKAQ